MNSGLAIVMRVKEYEPAEGLSLKSDSYNACINSVRYPGIYIEPVLLLPPVNKPQQNGVLNL